MAESAFAVNVREAEAYVGTLRERFDPSAKLGVPAHVTVLYPFMSPEEITEMVLSKVRLALSSIVTFTFCLKKIRRFQGAALYLAPEPAEPFIALTKVLIHQFPDFLPYGGQFDSIVPHLTVAQAGESEQSLAEVQLATALPRTGIQATCNEVVLIENSSGRWKHMHSFFLKTS